MCEKCEALTKERDERPPCQCVMFDDSETPKECGLLRQADEEIDRLKQENAGLKEYSDSRDESIKVYREEIKELKQALDNATENRWSAWEIERAEVKGDNMAKEFRIEDLEQEIKELKERLKPIQEVYKRQNKGGDGGGANSFANDCWQAIKKACEVKEMGQIGVDCCNQAIIPIEGRKLTMHTNRHPNTDGTRWGWIEGCTLNICWSDNKLFNAKSAVELIKKYNEQQP